MFERRIGGRELPNLGGFEVVLSAHVELTQRFGSRSARIIAKRYPSSLKLCLFRPIERVPMRASTSIVNPDTISHC